MLLDARANVNHQDKFGYAPLHIAALNEYAYCANLLLCYGADITVRTNGGTTALSMIVRKIPSVLPKFEDMLDQAITLAEHDINDVDCELKLDYKVLIPNKCKGESTMFMAFIETGHNHLLKHPLCESFLHLKWLKVRKFFFVSLAFHLIFTMLHTAFVLLVYSNQCILRDNCRYGRVSPGQKINFEEIKRIDSYKSVSGDCFDPYLEQCRYEYNKRCDSLVINSRFALQDHVDHHHRVGLPDHVHADSLGQGSVPADAQPEALLPQLGELGPVGNHRQRCDGQLPQQSPGQHRQVHLPDHQVAAPRRRHRCVPGLGRADAHGRQIANIRDDFN